MSRRALALLTALAAALVLPLGAQARAVESSGVGAMLDDYQDGLNDGEYGNTQAPDIAGVRVLRDAGAGSFSFAIQITNEPTQLARGEVNVFLNSDRDRATGSGGYDQVIKVSGANGGFTRLDRWSPAGWSAAPAPSLTASWNGGPTISISGADLGGISAFDFLVQAGWENPRAIYSDFAPNIGSWAFPSGSGSPVVTPPGPPPPPPDLKPPNTVILAGPPVNARSRSASFRFKSNETKTIFECKLDRGKWANCRSPKVYRGLAKGQHRFQVRAIDYVGHIDRTPAFKTWRVR